MLRNKSLLLVSVVLLLTCTLSAQKKFRPSLNLSGADEETWNFGVLFGNYPNSSADFLENYTVRFSLERTLIPRFDLRLEPGVILKKQDESDSSNPKTEIQLPILFKYSANRVGNINPFIIGGYQLGYRMPTESTTLAHYIETGLGFDFYLKKSKAGLHLRVQHDISDTSKTAALYLLDLALKPETAGNCIGNNRSRNSCI
jgi:hypothetical protein